MIELEFFREGKSAKHITDIRGILRHQGERIDQAAIDARISQLGLQEQWRQVIDEP